MRNWAERRFFSGWSPVEGGELPFSMGGKTLSCQTATLSARSRFKASRLLSICSSEMSAGQP
jgi:hypothetical protein